MKGTEYGAGRGPGRARSETIWSEQADWWIGQASVELDPDYAEVIMPILRRRLADSGTVVDLGCGEGRVGRALTTGPAPDGRRVVIGCDLSGELLAAAAVASARSGAPQPLLAADLARLPFADGSVDSAVCVLVLEHLADPSTALSEACRILRPGGRFVAVVNHPLVAAPDSTWIHDHLVDPPDHHFRLGRYLDEGPQELSVSAGVEVDFHHRTIGSYVELLRGAGFQIEAIDEPPPAAAVPGVERGRDVPLCAVLTGTR